MYDSKNKFKRACVYILRIHYRYMQVAIADTKDNPALIASLHLKTNLASYNAQAGADAESKHTFEVATPAIVAAPQHGSLIPGL